MNTEEFKKYLLNLNIKPTSDSLRIMEAKQVALSKNENIDINFKATVTLSSHSLVGTELFSAKFSGCSNREDVSSSYITQYWICFLYFHVIPIGKYRVVNPLIRTKNESYFIISKVPINGLKEYFKMFYENPSSLIAWTLIALFAINYCRGLF